MPVTVSILTPPEPGAIGVLHVQGADASALGAAMAALAIPLPPVGGVRVASIAGVDTGVVIRWTQTSLHLMSHAGPAVMGEIIRRLVDVGVTHQRADAVDPRALYPEAAGEVEARMLWALAHAASPRAIDLLLDQPRRWSAREAVSAGAGHDSAFDRALKRLLDPPAVVAVGPPNIGKSTLCNALAGRGVAIVADEPGTTRDHVGVMLDLDGLVVRYIDTPGMTSHGARGDAPSFESEAVAIARTLACSADLILCCGDATAPPISLESLFDRSVGARTGTEGTPSSIGSRGATKGSSRLTPTVVTVCLRHDLGAPTFTSDADVSAREPDSIRSLALRVRQSLVPDAVLADPRPWKFWP